MEPICRVGGVREYVVGCMVVSHLIGGPNSRGGHPPRDVTWACILLLDVQEHRLAGVPFYYRRTAVDRTLLEP